MKLSYIRVSIRYIHYHSLPSNDISHFTIESEVKDIDVFKNCHVINGILDLEYPRQGHNHESPLLIVKVILR